MAMDMNEFALGHLVDERLTEMREQAARYNLVAAVAPPRVRLRVALGHALVRMGSRLLGGTAAARAGA
ncbi:MAG: hypothetical protein ACREM3_04660 [Candidatus Rokuibacteriota bacterium]